MPHRWSPFLPPGPFVMPVRVDPTGRAGPTPGAARGNQWERTSPGHYVPAGTDRDRPEQRIVEAMTPAPSFAALTGWGALRLHGGVFFDGRILGRTVPVPVRVPLPSHPRPRDGVRF